MRIVVGMFALSTLVVALPTLANAQAASQAPVVAAPPAGALGSAKPFVVPRPGVLPGTSPGGSDPVGAAFRQWLTRAAGYKHTPETDRADRVSVLIDAGRCSEARKLADSEGDVLMAERVPTVCRWKAQGLLEAGVIAIR